jgi:hypothetical protein
MAAPDQKMVKYAGIVKTWVNGSDCAFEFELPADATQDEIEREAREAALDLVNWHFGPVTSPTYDAEE